MDLGAAGLVQKPAGFLMHPQLPLGIGLLDSACFGSFYPGPNAEVVDSLKHCAGGAGERFIYVCGDHGLGKSHLLQSACHHATQAGYAAAYLPLEHSADMSTAWLDGLDELDLVCIDDVQMIAGKPEWELALFNLYNRIRNGEGRLVVSGLQRPPKTGIELPDLVSRLSWGLIYPLNVMNDEQRLIALQMRARVRGLDLPAEAGNYLLRRSSRDMPALFSLMEQLDHASLAAQRRLTIPFVKSVLARIDGRKPAEGQ